MRGLSTDGWPLESIEDELLRRLLDLILDGAHTADVVVGRGGRWA